MARSIFCHRLGGGPLSVALISNLLLWFFGSEVDLRGGPPLFGLGF